MGRLQDFGEVLGGRLHAEHRPAITARALPAAEATVAEVWSERPTLQRSDPMPFDTAYVAVLQLRDYPRHEWWEDGRQAPRTGLRAGDMTLYDLRRDPRFTINSPFHSVHVHLPLALLSAARRDSGGSPLTGMRWNPGQGVDDPVFRHLALALRPALARPGEASRLLVDAVVLAIAAHVALTYGAPGSAVRLRRGLSPARLRVALEMIDARLDGTLRIGDLARRCDLSPSHFVQAFRAATGTTPHRWLTARRIERARELLRDSSLPLAQVALACGFANQSHFTRVFTRANGLPPGAWRTAPRA